MFASSEHARAARLETVIRMASESGVSACEHTLPTP
jgi:hypothetical protein